MTDEQTAEPRVGIVTDSSCDLPADTATRLGIEIVPLSIRFGDEELVDREELSTDEFWARCAASAELPSTAAPSPGRFATAYRRLAERGCREIVTINLSAALSATMRSAELGAAEVADDGIAVEVIDSRTVSLGLGTIVIAAAEAARDGLPGGGTADAAGIAAYVGDLIGRTRVYGALDTLDNLKKGGRIGGAKALLATALSIKPLIEVRDGVVEQSGKQRTRTKALRFLVDAVAQRGGQLDHLAVLHANCSDVDAFVEQLRPHASGDIVVGQIGPVVGAHAGPGTIGVAFHDR